MNRETDTDAEATLKLEMYTRTFSYILHVYEFGQGNVFYTCLSFSSEVKGGFPERDPFDRDPPPRMVKSGWYASYWNTFVLFVQYIWEVFLTHFSILKSVQE